MTSDELKRLFGVRVQALRRRRGLTQEELAEAISKSVDTISNIERGFSSTRIETALKIADAVGVTLAELFEFEESTSNKDREHRKAMEGLNRLIAGLSAEQLNKASKLLQIAMDI